MRILLPIPRNTHCASHNKLRVSEEKSIRQQTAARCGILNGWVSTDASMYTNDNQCSMKFARIDNMMMHRLIVTSLENLPSISLL